MLRRKLGVLLVAAMMIVILLAAGGLPAYADAGGVTPSGEQKAPVVDRDTPSGQELPSTPPEPSPVPGDQQNTQCFYNPDAPESPELGLEECQHNIAPASGLDLIMVFYFFRPVPGHETADRYEYVCDPATGQCGYVLVSTG